MSDSLDEVKDQVPSEAEKNRLDNVSDHLDDVSDQLNEDDAKQNASETEEHSKPESEEVKDNVAFRPEKIRLTFVENLLNFIGGML